MKAVYIMLLKPYFNNILEIARIVLSFRKSSDMLSWNLYIQDFSRS